MLTVLVVMQLAAGDGRGEGPSPVTAAERHETRLRGAVHLAGAVGFSGYAAGVGPGFSAELGATWQDTTSLVVRLTVCTIVLVQLSSLGVGLDFALSDHVSLGTGLSLSFLGALVAQDLSSALGLFVPVRLVIAPLSRERSERRRNGLSIFFEVAPGVRLLGGGVYAPPSSVPVPWFSMTGALGIGWAWW